MVDLDPIPFADEATITQRGKTIATVPGRSAQARMQQRPDGGPRWPLLAFVLLTAFGIAHGLAIWRGIGGARGSDQWLAALAQRPSPVLS